MIVELNIATIRTPEGWHSGDAFEQNAVTPSGFVKCVFSFSIIMSSLRD